MRGPRARRRCLARRLRWGRLRWGCECFGRVRQRCRRGVWRRGGQAQGGATAKASAALMKRGAAVSRRVDRPKVAELQATRPATGGLTPQFPISDNAREPARVGHTHAWPTRAQRDEP